MEETGTVLGQAGVELHSLTVMQALGGVATDGPVQRDWGEGSAAGKVPNTFMQHIM